MGRPTEDEDSNNKHDGAKQIVQDIDGLINIMQAARNRVSVLTEFADRQDHLVETDITIAVSV